MPANDHSSSQHGAWIAAARLEFERVRKTAAISTVNNRIGSVDRFMADGVDLQGYKILRRVHRGGQGVVYEALQQATGRTVALKIMHDGPGSHDGSSASADLKAADLTRFDREVSILAQLNHRNIISVIDRGSADGSNFLVMDFVDGLPVDRYARENDLSQEARLELFVTICDAVNAAHQRGVIHRDLKPGNILIDASGQPHILDFGLAKVSGESAINELNQTMTGQFVGSLPWVAPEQALGKLDQVDVRSDVYSLGVMLYQLLTDQFPYSVVGNLSEVLNRICHAAPQPPSTLARDVDDELETIVLKSLSKEPDRRYQSVGELARDVQHYLKDEPIEAKRDSGLYIVRKTLRRYRVAAAILAGFVVLSAGSAVAMSILYGRVKKEAAKSHQIASFSEQMIAGIDPATAGSMDKKLMKVVLDNAAARIDTDLSQQPEAEAEIRNTIGRAYQAIGEYDKARAHLQNSWESRRSILGPDAPDTLASLNDLAYLHHEVSRDEEALPLAREAAERRHRVLGDEDPDTLTSDSNLAEVLGDLKRFDEAQPLCQRTLDVQRRVLGAEHPNTLSSMNNLSMILLALNQFDEAEQLMVDCLEKLKRVRGDEHPHTLRSIGNLSVVYMEQGKLEKARELSEADLKVRQKIFGEDHPDTLTCMSNLAELYRKMDQLELAEQMFQKLIAARTRTMGPDHPENALNFSSLALIAGSRRDYAAAEKNYREAFRINQKSLPKDNWIIASAEFSLGVAVAKQRRFAEAEPLLLESAAAMQGRPEVPQGWLDAIPRQLSSFYEGWDAAEPGTGKAEKAAEWKAKLPPPPPATASAPA